LNPSQALDSSRLVSNRAVLGFIEKLIGSESIDDELRRD
jgi:hypothetical protein